MTSYNSLLFQIIQLALRHLCFLLFARSMKSWCLSPMCLHWTRGVDMDIFENSPCCQSFGEILTHRGFSSTGWDPKSNTTSMPSLCFLPIIRRDRVCSGWFGHRHFLIINSASYGSLDCWVMIYLAEITDKLGDVVNDFVIWKKFSKYMLVNWA